MNNKNMCDKLHELFNKMKTYTCNTINEIPFERGIYIFFDNDEKYNNLKRIVRVGTHGTSKDNDRLKQRLNDHFFKKDKDGSIFRLNVGKGLIKNATNSYYWDHISVYVKICQYTPSEIDFSLWIGI